MGLGLIVVPDVIGAMAAVGRADFRAVVVVEPIAEGSSLSLKALFRIARLRHRTLALVVIGAASAHPGLTALNVRFIPEPEDAAALERAISAAMVEAGARLEPPRTDPDAGQGDEDEGFDDPTILDPRAPALLEGAMSAGVGAAVLAAVFAQELSGRLEVDGGPAAGTLYFAAGEPIAAGHPDGDDGLASLLIAAGLIERGQLPRFGADRPLLAELSRSDAVPAERLLAFLRGTVRDRVLGFVAQSDGHYAFFGDDTFMSSCVITKVNSFGLMLEARRRRMAPLDILRAQIAVEGKFVLAGVGLGRAAARLVRFAGGVDLSEKITGRTKAVDIIREVGLDPLMGTLLLLTLEDARLVTFAGEPQAEAPPPTSRHVTGSRRFDLPSDVFDLDGPTDPDDDPEQQRLSRLYLTLAPVNNPRALLDVREGATRDEVESAYEHSLQLISDAAPSAATRPALRARAELLRKKLTQARRALLNEEDPDPTSRERAPTNPQVGEDGRRYELVQPIGKGGMAEVFVGRQVGMQGFAKRVVLKRILPELASNKLFVDMFTEEARVAARITHPNVVQIFDLGRSSTETYIVMEYVDGTDLNTAMELLRAAQLLFPVELAARIVADVAGGLHAAHSYVDDDGKPSPIIHRDVSPHNVLISKDGHVKIADFGIAKAADSRLVTAAGVYKGKMSFLSPEYIQGQPADARSDVFAAGIVLYILLTGKHPFGGPNLAAMIDMVINSNVPPIGAQRPDVPAALQEITRKAMARLPADRYQTAREMQEALEAFIIAHGRPAMAPQVAEWIRRALAGRASTSGAARHEPTRIFLQDT